MSRVLYLSASIANAAMNDRLRASLPPRYELILPQDFTPDVPHAELPRAIVDRCLEAMERCDAGVLMLDGFGIDCAMEAGWLRARGTPVIGLAAASTHFLRHWMVKGCLDALVCLDPAVAAPVEADAMLAPLPRALSPGWEGVADAFDAVLPWSAEGT